MVHEVPLNPITVGFAFAKPIFGGVFWACNLNVFLSFNAVIYRWQQAVSNSVLCSILAFLNFAYTLLVLNYSCIGFQVSSKPLNQALVVLCHVGSRKFAMYSWNFRSWMEMGWILVSKKKVGSLNTMILLYIILSKRFFRKILTWCYGSYLWCTYDFALGFIFAS